MSRWSWSWRRRNSDEKYEFEIGRILHLTPEIRNMGLDLASRTVQFAVSDFGFEMQDSSDFRFSRTFLLRLWRLTMQVLLLSIFLLQNPDSILTQIGID